MPFMLILGLELSILPKYKRMIFDNDENFSAVEIQMKHVSIPHRGNSIVYTKIENKFYLFF